jgi:AraC-like DNA-binding protein
MNKILSGRIQEISNREFILKNINLNCLDPNFNVFKLSDNLRYNRSSLSEISIKLFGLSTHKLIENIRLQRALEFFMYDNPVAQVAYHSGYDNSRTFRIAFKKRLNMTPSSFIKMISYKPLAQKINIVQTCVKLLWNE